MGGATGIASPSIPVETETGPPSGSIFVPVERSVDAEGVEIGVPSSEGRGVRSSERCRRRMMRTSDGKRRSNLG